MNHQQKYELYSEVFGALDETFCKYRQVGEPVEILDEIKRATTEYIIQETPREKPITPPPNEDGGTRKRKKRYGKQ